ncbi:MAG: hypothetical protein FJX74_09965 [Armatimonadetes bacterium]|nr:hypothetical protein [Armatimonadota bacterium]
MRKAAAILTCLLLVLSVGVAYSKCGQEGCGQASCPSPCPGNCPSASSSCSSCPNASASCPAKTECADCDGASCALKDCDKVATVSGTVRYVRSTHTAVKVVNGDQGLLLRIKSDCAQSCGLKAKLAALTKGDAVSAKYWTCPQSGKHYLVDIAGGATAAESAATAPAPAGCPSTGGCGGGGCGGQ